MREFLNEYMVSLTKNRRERVQDLLVAAQVGKINVEQIASQLVDLRLSSPITIGLEAVNGMIQAAKLDSSYNDALQRLQELFQASNLVSLILDSHTAMLSSEIKAIEDEINAIEKTIENYAFTLEENGFYDYVFSETFNDETMSDKETLTILTDRDETIFTEEQRAYVNSNSGILTLDPDLTTSYNLVGSVVENNCLSYAITETGLREAFNQNLGVGWKANISSPRPIVTSLVDELHKGAQVKIRCSLLAPSPSDTIVITPLSDSPVYLLSIKLYEDDFNSEPTEILATPSKLEQPHVVTFPLQSVVGFEFVISQPVYTRDSLPPSRDEALHRQVYEKIKDNRMELDERNSFSYPVNKLALKRIFLHSIENSNQRKKSYIYKAHIPVQNFEFSTGVLSFDNKQRIDQGDVKKYKNQINHVLRRMIHEKIFASNTEVINDRHVLNVSTAFLRRSSKLNASLKSNTSQEYPRVNVDTPVDYRAIANPALGQSKYLDYKYNLGIRNVEIGTGIRNFKGIYISKQLPAESRSDEVKIKVDNTNFDLINTSRDSSRLTSIEYSVTNKSNPNKESDWIPILPIDEDSVIGERVFFNEAGVCRPRFLISNTETFALFKNGYQIDNSLLEFNKTEDNQAIKSFRIPIDQIFINDIFTIDYKPYGNAGIINFKDKGFDENILASAFDETGGGQTFNTTGPNNTVTLNYNPYVNYEQVKANGSYSTTLGYVGTYQPITVIMSDGSAATNFTNYKGITQTKLTDLSSSTVGYIHSGNKLIFNQSITEPFTVYYQYLPSNLRFRIVMRSNSIDYVSPIVSTLQIKSKTRKPDARKVI